MATALGSAIETHIREGLIKGADSSEPMWGGPDFSSPLKTRTVRRGIKAALWRWFTQWDEEQHERFPDIWTKELIERLEKKGWYIHISYSQKVLEPIKVKLTSDVIDYLAYEITRGIWDKYQLQGHETLESIHSMDMGSVRVIQNLEPEIARWDAYAPPPDAPAMKFKTHTVDLEIMGYGCRVQLIHVHYDIQVRLKVGRWGDRLWLRFGSMSAEKSYPWE